MLINYCSRNSPDGNEINYHFSSPEKVLWKTSCDFNPTINGIPSESIGSLSPTLTATFTNLNIGLLGQWVYLYLTIGISIYLLGKSEAGNSFVNSKITDWVERILDSMFDCVDDIDDAPFSQCPHTMSRFYQSG